MALVVANRHAEQPMMTKRTGERRRLTARNRTSRTVPTVLRRAHWTHRVINGGVINLSAGHGTAPSTMDGLKAVIITRSVRCRWMGENGMWYRSTRFSDRPGRSAPDAGSDRRAPQALPRRRARRRRLSDAPSSRRRGIPGSGRRRSPSPMKPPPDGLQALGGPVLGGPYAWSTSWAPLPADIVPQRGGQGRARGLAPSLAVLASVPTGAGQQRSLVAGGSLVVDGGAGRITCRWTPSDAIAQCCAAAVPPDRPPRPDHVRGVFTWLERRTVARRHTRNRRARAPTWSVGPMIT